MRLRNACSALAICACLTSAAGAAQAQARHTKVDPRDARIDALEQEVHDLATELRAMRAERLAAPTVAGPAPSTGSGAQVVGEAPAAGPAASQPGPGAQSPNQVQTASVAPAAGGATDLAGKPSISTPDGRFSAQLHGVMQFDAADYLQDHAGPAATDLRRGAAATDSGHARDLNDGTNFRRARIGIDGKVFGDFEYNVLFDFAGSGAEDAGHIQELWVQYSGLKPFHLRVGAFTPSFGLEDQNSTNGMPFLERPASVDLSRGISASDYREGAQLWAATDRWYGAFAITSRLVGTINSTGSSTAQSFDQSMGLVGRAAWIPFKGEDWLTHIGVHGSYALEIADAGGPDVAAGTARYPVTLQERPELRVDGTRLISTGAIDAEHASVAAAEAAAQWGPLYVQGEYTHISVDRRNSALSDPDFDGFYVEGSWILTGERRKYNTNTFAFDAPPIEHPFSLQAGTWGAWEFALRYSDMDLNYREGLINRAPATDAVRGGDQQIYTAGVNWYLNPLIRFMFDFQHVDVNRLSPNATTFLTPVGAQVGQSYNALAVRSQFAF